LREALAGGEKTVFALQEKARTAGLLGERQSITDSKSFRSAKAALGVRSGRATGLVTSEAGGAGRAQYQVAPLPKPILCGGRL
jgi:hypothetical protein